MPLAASRWPILVFTDPIGSLVRPVLAERLADGVRLQRIAHRRAGAVRLQVADVVGRDAGPRVHLAQQPLLRRVLGTEKPFVRPSELTPEAEDHAADRVAIGVGVAQRLQQHRAAALGAHVAVGLGVERLAAATARQHRGAGKADERMRRQNQVDAADQRGRNLARDGSPRTAMCSATSEDEQAVSIVRLGSVQVELVRQPVRHRRQRHALHRVIVGADEIGRRDGGVVPGRPADEHPDSAVRQGWSAARRHPPSPHGPVPAAVAAADRCAQPRARRCRRTRRRSRSIASMQPPPWCRLCLAVRAAGW